ncbi:HD-domain/PDEase-like protein, partial [Neocallimastix californiae]
ELYGIILGMFNKYNAIKDEISLIHIFKFVAEIRSTYNDVPYHTFRHASDVCFVTYYMFTELRSNIYLKYSRLEVIAMLIAALGHDMYHPGYNNLFQINTKSELAIKYNGKSVLEQYSADCLVELIKKFFCDLIVEVILSTDMRLSVRLLEHKQYQLLSENQRRIILNGLLHAADISNAARPWYVCEEWSNRVVEEFWRQGDEEKRLNLTVSPNMDRDRFERNGISIAFNDFITTPFYEVIYELIPTFEIFVKLLHINRQKWNDL